MSATAGLEPAHLLGNTTTLRDAGSRHVALIGDVSGLRALRLQTELLTAAEVADRLVVNLSRVTHLSVIAIRSLLRARALTEERHAQFDVQGLSPAATLAFARAGLRWTGFR
jgi:anti-anti-sigma regulatory factor